MTGVRSADDRRRLLRFARETAGRLLGAGVESASPPQVRGTFGGVFVTLWNGKALRGCVGTFEPTTDLAATVACMVDATLRDSRFEHRPVTAAELPSIQIEISVLSTPQATGDPLSLIPGVHGVIVRRGERSGCFLPKVAGERGWSAEEMLSQCCVMKAGLDRDAWRDPDSHVELFEADVLSEADPPAKTGL